MRFLIFLVSFVAAGISFPKLLIDDASRRRNFLKDGAPEVDDSYERVKSPGRTYHDLKNVLVEWVRADPQLAGKCLTGLFVWSWGLYWMAKFLCP